MRPSEYSIQKPHVPEERTCANQRNCKSNERKRGRVQKDRDPRGKNGKKNKREQRGERFQVVKERWRKVTSRERQTKKSPEKSREQADMRLLYRVQASINQTIGCYTVYSMQKRNLYPGSRGGYDAMIVHCYGAQSPYARLCGRL